jgi:hypothetical protein
MNSPQTLVRPRLVRPGTIIYVCDNVCNGASSQPLSGLYTPGYPDSGQPTCAIAEGDLVLVCQYHADQGIYRASSGAWTRLYHFNPADAPDGSRLLPNGALINVPAIVAGNISYAVCLFTVGTHASAGDNRYKAVPIRWPY